MNWNPFSRHRNEGDDRAGDPCPTPEALREAGELKQLTKDQSLVNQLIEAGQLRLLAAPLAATGSMTVMPPRPRRCGRRHRRPRHHRQ